MTNERAPISGFHPRLRHLVQDDDFAVATLDQYLLLVWRRQITVAGALAASDAMARLCEERATEKLGFITLIEDGCSLSTSSEVRELMALMLKNHNYVIGGAAIAYERDGFWSAMARSVITAINVASRAVFPTDVSGKLEEAVRFVSLNLGDNSDQHRAMVLKAAQQMRGNGEHARPRESATRRLQAWVRGK